MGASARIVIAFLLVSVAYSVPTGHYGTTYLDDDKDLSAESSKIIPAAESPRAAHHTPDADHSIELVSDAQNFFPSFANLFELRRNNYRFGGFQTPSSQEGAYSQRPNSYRSLLNYPSFSNYINLEGLGKHSPTAAPIAEASSVLGSGNFGIIRGGTFLSQNDEEDDGFGSSDYGFGYNGHGRPAHNGYVGNPRPSYGQDQFANFRDFADINAPSNYVVVYANRNATLDEVSEESRLVASKPRNIFETLQGIEVPQPTKKKISKTKSKLEATKQKMLKKKEQWKKGNSKYHSQKHEVDEPLLALS